MPFLDNFIHHYRAPFSRVLAVSSASQLGSLMWHASPLPLTACLRLLLNLIPTFVETSFYPSIGVLARVVCILLLYLASFDGKHLAVSLGVLAVWFGSITLDGTAPKIPDNSQNSLWPDECPINLRRSLFQPDRDLGWNSFAGGRSDQRVLCRQNGASSTIARDSGAINNCSFYSSRCELFIKLQRILL